MKRRPIEVIARGVCVRSGRVLLCHSKGNANTYLPGGHVEFQEAAAESLRREIREELGLKAVVLGFLGAVEHTFVQRGERHCEINLVFEVGIGGVAGARAPASREDYIEFLWAGLKDLRKARLEPWPLCRLLPAWLRRRGSRDAWASTYAIGKCGVRSAGRALAGRMDTI